MQQEKPCWTGNSHSCRVFYKLCDIACLGRVVSGHWRHERLCSLSALGGHRFSKGCRPGADTRRCNTYGITTLANEMRNNYRNIACATSHTTGSNLRLSLAGLRMASPSGNTAPPSPRYSPRYSRAAPLIPSSRGTISSSSGGALSLPRKRLRAAIAVVSSMAKRCDPEGKRRPLGL